MEYKMMDGSVYVRLNATTWNLKKEEKLYRKNDIDQFVTSKTSELNRFKRRAQEKIMKLHCQYEALEDNLSEIQRCLFQKILREKEAAEKQLAGSKYSFLCCLI
jgi:predicted nuclease with TOPRIM domain